MTDITGIGDERVMEAHRQRLAEKPAGQSLGAYRHLDDQGNVRRIPDEVVRQHIEAEQRTHSGGQTDAKSADSNEIAYLLRSIRAELREANSRTFQLLKDALEVQYGTDWQEKLKKQRGAKAMLADKFGKPDTALALLAAILERGRG